MLNQKLFNLIAARMQGRHSIRVSSSQEIHFMELVMVDVIAKTLENKVRQGMGLFGPTRSPDRTSREERRNPILMFDYRCTISTSNRCPPGPTITVNVAEPNEPWEEAEFYIESRCTGIIFKNTAYVPPPPPAEPAEGQPAQERQSGIRRDSPTRQAYGEFREHHFDADHFKHFIRMLDEATSEVLHMAIPQGDGLTTKLFQDGQIVYHLGVPNRVHAAGLVMAQQLGVMTAAGDLTDLRVMDLSTRSSRLVFSGHYGTEVEWLQANTLDTRRGTRDEFREREWGDATDEQVLYIEDMLSRLNNLP